MARVFFMSPLYHIVRVLPSCPLNLTAGLWTVPFRRLPTLSRTIKSKAKYFRSAQPCFLCALILPDVDLDAKPLQTRTLAGVARRVCVALRARCESATAGPSSCRSFCALQMSCVFAAQLAFSLCGLLGFVRRHSRNMVTACS